MWILRLIELMKMAWLVGSSNVAYINDNDYHVIVQLYTMCISVYNMAGKHK